MGDEGRGGSDGLNVSVPNWARIGNYFLDGKDHFAADRKAAEELLSYAPEIRTMTVELKEFHGRVVRHLAAEGMTQFLVVGAGLPSSCNTHVIARETQPRARVVYVADDPVVLSHGRALVATDDDTGMVEGDLLNPAAIIDDRVTRRLIDPALPVVVIIPHRLQFTPDVDEPYKRVGELRDWMPAGSHLVVTHAVLDSRPKTADPIVSVYQRIFRRTEDASRTRQQVLRFFDGTELLDPGLVYIRQWRPDHPLAARNPERIWTVGGVGRKPGP